MNQTALAEKANKVAAHVTDRRVGIDPTVIAVIIEVLTELVKLWQNCKHPPQMPYGLLDRWHVRRVVRKHLDDYEFYREHGHEIVTGVLTLTPQDVKEVSG